MNHMDESQFNHAEKKKARPKAINKQTNKLTSIDFMNILI